MVLSKMAVFHPDEEVIQRIVRVIEDVLQHGTDPINFVERSDSVEPTTAMLSTMDIKSTEAGDETVAVDAKMDMEWTVNVDQTAAVGPTAIGDQKADVDMTVAGNQTVAVDATMDKESTVIVDQTAAVDLVADVVSSDPTMPKDFSASMISNLEKPSLEINQKYKRILCRLFAMKCKPLENYLMVIINRSSIDIIIRLVSGHILNDQLINYYEGIPSAVIAFLRAECLSSMGDISSRIRDCNRSLIKQLAKKGLCKWPEILPAIIVMLDSEELNMYEGALDVLEMITYKFNLEDLPNNPLDILIPKLITLFGTKSLTKRSISVSIIKELIERKTPGVLNHITVLLENILYADNVQLNDEYEENNNTLLSIDVCKSITALVQSKRLPKDDIIHKIIRYMIDKSKDKDDKIVKEACRFWITIFKEQFSKYRSIMFPYLYYIMSTLADKLMFTQEDLTIIQNGHVCRDYPFFTDSDSLRKHCVYVIDAMIIGFKEDVLPVIVQIINRKVSDTDLNKKEIAIVLLGCVAESKECRKSIEPYLETSFNNLILLNNYLITGEALFRDKLLWTLVTYRHYIFYQPQYMEPLMTYMLRSEIECPLQYSYLEGEAFWNLVTDQYLSKDALQPYLTDVLSRIFKALNYFKLKDYEDDDFDPSTDRSTRNNSTDALTYLIWIYKADILPLIMPKINECIASDDPNSKKSGIVALGLLAKGGVSDMILELPQYLTYMIDTLSGDNPNLAAAACLSLGRHHNWIVNRSPHDKYFVPLMEYLLTTETEYTSSNPYILSCVLFTLEFLLLDKPNSINLFAPYLKRIVANMCKTIVFADTDLISLQGDDEEDENYLDGPMIVCKQFESYVQDENVDEMPQYKCSSDSYNRGRASHILTDVTTIYKCGILPTIMPIIQAALKSDDWKVMESGIFVLGIINSDDNVENAFTDDEWNPYFKEFFNCMMNNLSSKRPIIRASIMVTLSRYSFCVVNKTHKKYLLPLMRMVSARTLDSNLNVRSTAWKVWNILRHEISDDEPIIKWYMDHIWKELTDMVEFYRSLQRGQDYIRVLPEGDENEAY